MTASARKRMGEGGVDFATSVIVHRPLRQRETKLKARQTPHTQTNPWIMEGKITPRALPPHERPKPCLSFSLQASPSPTTTRPHHVHSFSTAILSNSCNCR